ncbi:PIN3 [Candida oxycetoniae]|uniref:PIN3 n=1 Tax=Candida oxycetoniae TaxID=497107 RepID=A0AAI9WXP1_9ASCO|nr:PIN3 [Candida oxycetoniae]KAI3404273.1 PIN3 [Candida oxycetoniae]
MSAALVNRSLTTVRTELEFLKDSDVITEELYDALVQAIPLKYQKDKEPWGIDVLNPSKKGPVNYASNDVKVSQPNRNPSSYEEKTNKLTEAFANTSLKPPAYPPTPVRKEEPLVGYCVAMYDYKAQEADDLTLYKGDKLGVVEHLSEDWWKGFKSGESRDKMGVFPSNYVEIISEQEFSETTRVPAAPSLSSQNSYASYGPQAQYGQAPIQQQPSYGGGYAQFPPPSSTYQPPQQYQVVEPQPQAVVQQQQPHSSGHEKVKKFGSRFGEAALFGAGASVGANIVNSIF